MDDYVLIHNAHRTTDAVGVFASLVDAKEVMCKQLWSFCDTPLDESPEYSDDKLRAYLDNNTDSCNLSDWDAWVDDIDGKHTWRIFRRYVASH